MVIARLQHTRAAIIALKVRRFLRLHRGSSDFHDFMAASLGLRYLAGLGDVPAAILAVIVASPISYFGHANPFAEL